MGGAILGLIVVVVGLMILIDVRGFGSWAMRLSLYSGAALWKSNARPEPERVDFHRALFGAGVTAVGLMTVAASVAGLV
jgi:hypothetical protein